MKQECQSLSRVRLLVTPWTVTHQARLSMGFSRQEYQSGLSFPSPGDLPDPGIEPRSALQADSLLSEPPGKTKNTGVRSLSLLQGIFPTQELNRALLHCRQMFYKLNYQGSPQRLLYLCLKLALCIHNSQKVEITHVSNPCSPMDE